MRNTFSCWRMLQKGASKHMYLYLPRNDKEGIYILVWEAASRFPEYMRLSINNPFTKISSSS